MACCLIFSSLDRLKVNKISLPPMSRMRFLLVADGMREAEKCVSKGKKMV